jgi:hypothetical protein
MKGADMSDNDTPIRRTVLPPLGDDGVRRWSGAAPDATAASDDTLIAVVADTMIDFIDGLPALIERAIEARVKRAEAEMSARIAESFAHLHQEVNALLGIRKSIAETHTRKGEQFRFAGERGESDDAPLDLPNWRTGRIIN